MQRFWAIISCMILNWKKIAREMYEQLSSQIKLLKNKPVLWAVLVWNSPESLRYIGQKRKFAEKIGMEFRLLQFEITITEEELKSKVIELNNNADISGYIIQIPLPSHIDPLRIIRNIDPKKDVDGFHPENQWKIMIWDNTGFSPCTPAWVMKMFEYYDISLPGKNIVILWQSNIVGKPMAQMCISEGATVTSCNHMTPDISIYTAQADIIISATGQVWLITPEIVNPKAVIIDIWFSVVDGKIFWDAKYPELLTQWNTITPVPGWVGPMTVAQLLSNTLQAHLLSHE
jgi:methylenetetrahydrofolate dehydrogenase (NADP+)/methenyltetrahydrofolate cyclohydrolase